MTECDRIIKQGILPESFFKEEIRCDYKVPKEKKKLWALQIDLYLELARVCAKLGLRYFAMFGTAMGAVRHGGFIPWDDDIDVVMPREDYDKLCNLYAKEFKSPYFLQTPYTDPGYYVSFAKLRNSNTAQISMPFRNAMFNQGVQIDIFPLDFCDPSKADRLHDEINVLIMKCSSFMKKGSEQFLNERQLDNFKRYQTDDPMGAYLEIQNLSMSCKTKDFVGIPCLTVYKPEKLIWPTSYFEEIEYHKFESIEIALPKEWDKVLTTCYGDYMKFPPIEQRGTWHQSGIWDFQHSYREYIDPMGGWLLSL